MAVSDALIVMGGALIQQVSQVSLYNLPTLGRGEEKQQISSETNCLLPAYPLKVTLYTLVNISECEECCNVSCKQNYYKL